LQFAKLSKTQEAGTKTIMPPISRNQMKYMVENVHILLTLM